MQMLCNGAVQSSTKILNACVIDKKAISQTRSMVSIKGDSNQADQSVGVATAALLPSVMIPHAVLKNGPRREEGHPLSTGVVANGTFTLVSGKGSENMIRHTINGALQYQTVRDSSGNIRLIPKSTSGTNGTEGETMLRSLSLSKELPKKMKITTVPKRVPLINTVGNQSKLVPLTPQTQGSSVTTESVPVISSVGKCLNGDSSKPMSILEARLISGTANSSTNTLHLSVAPGKSNGHQTSAISKDISEQGDAINSRITQTPKKPRAVISCEKGLTRLVAVEPRTVTMVDVSIQVFIPQLEDQGPDGKDLNPQSTPVPADSSALPGSVQAAGTKTPMPLAQKQLVLVDTKNGKKVLAIPKQIFNNYSGPKTFIIDGKGLKRKADGSPEPASKRLPNGSSAESTETTKLQVPPKGTLLSPAATSVVTRLLDNALISLNASIAAKSHLNKTNSSILTVSSSISSDTITTASSAVSPCLMSHPKSQNGTPDSIVLSVSPATYSGGPKSSDETSLITVSSASSNAHEASSDTLVWSINSPLKINPRLGPSSPSMPSESVSIPQSLPPSQLNVTSTGSIILPWNIPIGPLQGSLSEKTSSPSAPHSSPLFVLLPNGTDQEPKDSSNQNVREMSGSVENSTRNGNNGKIDDVGRNPQSFNKQWIKLSEASNHTPVSAADPSIKADPTGLRAKLIVNGAQNTRMRLIKSVGSLPVQLVENQGPRTSGGGRCSAATVDSCDGSNDAVNEPSQVEADQFVKSVFSEFRNCLVLNEGKCPIHAAVESNDYASVKRQCLLLKARRVGIDVPNSKDETPLQLALYHGHSSIVKLLLSQGANISVFDHDGNSPLHLAVMHAEDTLEDLLSHRQLDKKFINHLNDEGFSALHLAAQHDSLIAINLLVKSFADIDLPDGKSGRSALFHAMERKNYKAQALLEEFGANLKEPTYTGATPLHLTRTDAIAQITSSQGTVGTEVDADTILKSLHSSSLKVK